MIVANEIMCTVLAFVDNSKRENISGYLAGLEKGVEYSSYEQRAEELQKVIPMIEQSIKRLKFLEKHTCEYEDDYCIHCGKDGRA